MNLSEHQEAKLQAKGHIHWIDKKSNNIYKIYKKINLLDDLTDIENNKTTCADENKVDNEDETCGECLDGFMLNDDGECITCSSMYQEDGIGGVCGNCKEGFIVDEDEESDSYGNCIEEEPADYTILYAGGGLIALAVVATLMKK